MAIEHRTHASLDDEIKQLIHLCNAVSEACGTNEMPSWAHVVWTMANRIAEAREAEKAC